MQNLIRLINYINSSNERLDDEKENLLAIQLLKECMISKGMKPNDGILFKFLDYFKTVVQGKIGYNVNGNYLDMVVKDKNGNISNIYLNDKDYPESIGIKMDDFTYEFFDNIVSTYNNNLSKAEEYNNYGLVIRREDSSYVRLNEGYLNPIGRSGINVERTDYYIRDKDNPFSVTYKSGTLINGANGVISNNHINDIDINLKRDDNKISLSSLYDADKWMDPNSKINGNKEYNYYSIEELNEMCKYFPNLQESIKDIENHLDKNITNKL